MYLYGKHDQQVSSTERIFLEIHKSLALALEHVYYLYAVMKVWLELYMFSVPDSYVVFMVFVIYSHMY